MAAANNDAYHGTLAWGLIPVNLITELLRPSTYIFGLLLPVLIGVLLYHPLQLWLHGGDTLTTASSIANEETNYALSTAQTVWRSVSHNNLLSGLWEQHKLLTQQQQQPQPSLPPLLAAATPAPPSPTLSDSIRQLSHDYSRLLAGAVIALATAVLLFAGMWVSQRIMISIDANRHAILAANRSSSHRRSRSVSSSRSSGSSSVNSLPSSLDPAEVLASMAGNKGKLPALQTEPWKEVLTTETLVHLHANPDTKKLLPVVVSLVASMGSGKSVILRSFLYELRDVFKGGLIITGAKHNGDFDGIVPDDDIWDGFDKVRLETRVKAMLAYQTEQKRLKDAKQPYEFLVPNFVLFDDVGDVLGSRPPVIFDTLVREHRHLNCWVFFATQVVTSGLPPILRTVSNYTFLMRQQGEASRIMWKTFGKNLQWKLDEFLFHCSEAQKRKWHCLLSIALPPSTSTYRTFTATPAPEQFCMKYCEQPAAAEAAAAATVVAPAVV